MTTLPLLTSADLVRSGHQIPTADVRLQTPRPKVLRCPVGVPCRRTVLPSISLDGWKGGGVTANGGGLEEKTFLTTGGVGSVHGCQSEV